MVKESIEQQLKRLESLIETLNEDKLPLEKSLSVYEEAIKTYKSCRKELVKWEKKVSLLNDKLKEEELSLTDEEEV